MTKIFTDGHGEYENAISEFLEFYKQGALSKQKNVVFGLSDAALFQLGNLLDEKLVKNKLEVASRQEKIAEIKSEIEKIDGYLAVEIDEKEINRIYKEIKTLELELIEIEARIDSKQNIRRSFNGDFISANSAFNKKVESYLKKLETNDDGE